MLTRVSQNVARVILPYAGPKVFCRFCAPRVGRLLAGMCLQWSRWRRRLLHQAPKIYVWLSKSVEEEAPSFKFRNLKLITGRPSSTTIHHPGGIYGGEGG